MLPSLRGCQCLGRTTGRRGVLTGAHDISLLHLASRALDEPVGELLDGARLEVRIGSVRISLHLGVDGLDNVLPAMPKTGHTGTAACIEDLGPL